MTKTEISKYSQVLKNQFIKKIENEWPLKWNHYGPKFNYANISNKSAFLAEVLKEISEACYNKNSKSYTDDIISKDSLRRIFLIETPNEWQLKTRNNLACYLNYQNWDDFVAHNDVLETTSNNRLVSIKKQAFTVIGVILGISFIIWLYFFTSNDKKMEIINNNTTHNYPSSITLKLNLSPSQFPQYKVRIENENLEFSSQLINIENNLININFLTPGLKVISLLKNNQIANQTIFLVGSNQRFYGAARIRQGKPLTLSQNNQAKAWYGNRETNGNSSTNYLSSTADWQNIEKEARDNNLIEFPSKYLNSDKSLNTRVAFLKSDNFQMNLGEIMLSFEAKRDPVKMEDCLSFMTQLFDENLNKLEIFSSGNCEIDENIGYFKGEDLKLTGKTNKGYKVSSINKIFDDGKWHFVTISLTHHLLTFTIDHKTHFHKIIRDEFSKLKEVWFVFEGGGKVKNINLKPAIPVVANQITE